MERKKYVKPTMLVVKLKNNRQQLLVGSYDVIPPGDPNSEPA